MTDNLPAKAALTTGGAIAAIVPRDIDQTYRLAQAIAGSGIAPKSYSNQADKIMVGIMYGMELGLPPMTALRSIAVINGEPSVWGDGLLGLVRASGLLEEFRESIDGDADKMVATCRVKRKGEEPAERSFSVADAKKAKLWDKQGPWQAYPKRMLAMRARSWALRDTFADVLRGMRMAEEVMDAIDVVPQADGSYAPPPPKREEFEPVKSYPIVASDGTVVSIFAHGGEFIAALLAGIRSAIGEQGDVQAIWDANYETLDQVRADNPGIDVSELMTAYNTWAGAETVTLTTKFDNLVRQLGACVSVKGLQEIWKIHSATLKEFEERDPELFEKAIKAKDEAKASLSKAA